MARVAAALKEGLFRTGWYDRQLSGDVLPGVLVLCYHGLRNRLWRQDERAFPDLHIPPATFEAHCRVVATSCHAISLDQWRAADAGLASLPDRPVVLTFDDGYQSVYELARPILKRYRLPAALFACSEPIRKRRLFWYDVLARERGASAMWQIDQCGGNAGDLVRGVAAELDDPMAPLTVDQLKALADDGVEIGVHTATHANLGRSTLGRQREELGTCRDFLSRWIGGPIRALSYPWGRPSIDYSPATVALARELGFDMAFTTRPAFAARGHDAFERPRFLAMWDLGPAELAHRIAYAWR